MVLIGTSSAFDIAVQYLAEYVFGTPAAVGVYLLAFLFIALMMFRVEFSIGLVLLIPVDVVLIAAGYMVPLVGGLHVLIVTIILGLRFFRGT